MRIKTTNHNEYEKIEFRHPFFYEACYSAWSISIYSRVLIFWRDEEEGFDQPAELVDFTPMLM